MTASLAICSPTIDRLAHFVSKMREAAPFGDVSWNAPMWNLTGRLTRAGKRLHLAARDTLAFIQHRASCGDAAMPFSQPFDDFAKAVICARHLRASQTIGTHRVSLRALRYLHDALEKEGLTDPRRLERRHFHLAESAVRDREKISSAYRVGQRLEEIASLADQFSITPVRIQYSSSIPKSAVEPIATKMPKTETLDALGDISGSKDLYENKADLIRMRVVDILAATGFRIGEALTLPQNPIVRKSNDIGLRYWPEKGSKIRVKQISLVHRELVERAVRDLSSACAEARRVAQWCDAHPGRAPLPKDLPDKLFVRHVAALGLEKNGVQWVRSHHVPTYKEGRRLVYDRSDLEKALVALRDQRPLLITGDGQKQMLGQSLVVLFRHQLHDQRATNKFVPTPMRWGQVAHFLGSCDERASSTGSVFKRLNLRSSSGTYHKITTHQFRHWLSTIAKRGGLSEVELARWMGRRRIADNRAYDHRTQEERAEEVRALIRSGLAAGAVADAYHSLSPADAEAFLTSQVSAVLTTPYGACLHDYGQGPCERHFSCAGCPELLRRKGDPDERAALSTMLSRTRKNLQKAKAERADGTYGASNWESYNERLMIDLIAMAAVDADDRHQDGELIRVWPDNAAKKKVEYGT